MKISIANGSVSTIKPEDRIETSDIEALGKQITAIQYTFKEESKNYACLVENLRAWTKSHEQKQDIEKVITVAKEICASFKPQAFVTIGIGGSDPARYMPVLIIHSIIFSRRRNAEGRQRYILPVTPLIPMNYMISSIPLNGGIFY